MMNRNGIPIQASLLLVFCVSLQHLPAETADTKITITDWPASIQRISTADCADWPGITGAHPVDGYAAAGRIWLVWPEALVSLPPEGGSDYLTLLALFISSTASNASTGHLTETARWKPPEGIIDSGGLWCSSLLSPGELVRISPFTGQTDSRPWPFSDSSALYPSRGGAFIALSGNKVLLVERNKNSGAKPRPRLLFRQHTPVSHAAASRKAALFAWMEAGVSAVSILDYEGSREPLNLPLSPATAGRIHSMGFSGKDVVCGAPGQILIAASSPNTRNAPKNSSPIKRFAHPLIPGTWFKISGTEGRLLIYSPATGQATLIQQKAPSTDTPISPGAFKHLLSAHVVEAGEYLENSGSRTVAESFYSWALNLVRAERGRNPFSNVWPLLEEELTVKRNSIRKVRISSE